MEIVSFKKMVEGKLEAGFAFDDMGNLQRIIKELCKVRRIDEPCGSCGGTEVYCTYGDSGGSTYYEDNYGHTCLTCGEVNLSLDKISVGQECGGDEFRDCVYCGYRWL